ncbi:AGC/YANK protein kinase [Capronia coronata CBS 617.96]|uniref:AGC/YANK protein kinase n=1 Tax=Capronia coronata CBS 617.96 TaxID=1182541 RepID=W9YQH6_9EURO|nr:AGC/YANK protein kinase [Capronia coronata CBS 617.96]EXJ95177.1 AGC/YANK protein kinase [Capronia coronata CBS 617.96]
MGNTQGKPVVLTDQVNLNHFRLLRVVGKGAFGKVRIVERKDSGLTFALKYIRKDEVVRSESVRNIIRERRMLEHLNHPFLCNLRYSFQDVEYLYLVVDLMNGGDLRFHIQRKSFTEDAVRFWMAELACALRYIHSQGIVHRDVKPDNILLDSDGHVHLADFNVASDFKPGKPLTSKSGTLAYLAPEVFRGHGYYSEVDWWSLGVTMYECIYGKRPFEGKSHEELTNTICAANPRYFVTKPPVSMPCLHAMTSLIEKDRRKRIGATGFDTFTDHPFFQSIDFEALERKQISPIFIPSSEKTNFDATYDLEELLLEEAPLEARARRQKPRAELRNDASSKEIREDELHRMIETMFEPFDYTLATYDVNAAAAVAGTVPDEHVQLDTHQIDPHSAHTSPDGSPPLSPSAVAAAAGPEEHFPPLDELRAALPHSQPTQRPASSSKSFSRPIPPQRPVPATRQPSKGGGVQMVLGEAGSWSNLADQTSPMPADGSGEAGVRYEKGGGSMLGFLSRKKGRDRSPKPREPGVLGKYGARHIIS